MMLFNIKIEICKFQFYILQYNVVINNCTTNNNNNSNNNNSNNNNSNSVFIDILWLFKNCLTMDYKT